MTTLDSERSLTQLIVLYNFQDSVYVPADILSPFQLKDELDWWPRFSLIKSTAGCSGGKGKKIYNNWELLQHNAEEMMGTDAAGLVVTCGKWSSTRPHITRSIVQQTDNANMQLLEVVEI